MDNNMVAAGAGLVVGAGAVAGAVVAPAPAAGGGAALSAAQLEAIYQEIDALYELDQEVVPCEYETDDDVDADNFESYVNRQLARFQNGDLRVMRRGKHVCPFGPLKVKDGALASLEYHAMNTRHNHRLKMQGRADHEALGRFLLGPRLPPYGRILRNMNM